MPARKDKIFLINFQGLNDRITFFPRSRGDIGRDIAAVKLALGEVYYAPIPNNSPDDNTIGEAWFDCVSNQQVSTQSLLSFDKKLRKSLMAYQIENQFLILSYYLEKLAVRKIQSEGDIYIQVKGMINLFDAEFGNINEATLAVLHGWRPGSFISNRSFYNEQEFAVDQIPMLLYDFYKNGTIMQLSDEIIVSIHTRNTGEVDYEKMKSDFKFAAASFRNWMKGMPTESVQEAYVVYKSFSIKDRMVDSPLFTASREVLNFAHSEKQSDELTSAERERLVSRVFEPDYLLDPDPFIISHKTIGFFDRTPFTFRNLPDFEQDSNSDTIQSLKEAALDKVLDFYQFQKPDEMPLGLIKFVEFRVPSLRPGDVYRAYFEIGKDVLESLEKLDTAPTSAEDITIDQSNNQRLTEEQAQLADLYCTGGESLTEEQSKAQYEKYKSFASKKKLEISRKIRKAALDMQADSLNIDGIDLDLGVFGHTNLSRAEIIDLMTSIPDGILGLSSDAITSLTNSLDSDKKKQEAIEGEKVLTISYSELREKVQEASKRFEACEEDIENFRITGDPRFSPKAEAGLLREVISSIFWTLERDTGLRKQTVDPSRLELKEIVEKDDFELVFMFENTPQGSIISSIKAMIPKGLPGGVSEIIYTPEVTTGPTAAADGADYVQAEAQQGKIRGSLRRERTVHYLRNIKEISSPEFGKFIAHELLGGTCDDLEQESGRKGAFIIKYTKGINATKIEQNNYQPIHNARKNNFANARDTGGNKPDSEWYKFGDLNEVGAFGFEKSLPVIGDNCFTDKEAGKHLLDTIGNTISFKRIMCEYAACLGFPEFQLKLPDINMDALDFPEMPTLKIPGMDYWKQLGELIVEIFQRALCTLIKSIFDILQSPFCSEKFIADLYGRANDTAPEVKRALAEGFTDTGIPSEKVDKAKEFIDAIMNLLTPNELCALLNGEVLNAEVYHIIRGVAENLNLSQELETEEQITNFFATIGIFIGPEVCDNLARYSLDEAACSDVYSILQQIRESILKGENVSLEEIEKAAEQAEKNYKDKADALNFLAGNGGLEDLMPSLNATAENSVFATAPEFMKNSAQLAANTSFDLPKTSFVTSMNSFVSSFYVDSPSIADRNGGSYDSEANLVVQRSICNLQRFASFDLDPQSINLASPDTTKILRDVILVLCDDYKKSLYDNGLQPPFLEYTKIKYEINNPDANTQLLDGSLAEEYQLGDDRLLPDVRDQYSRLQDLSSIWQKMFPIGLGDIEVNDVTSTRTITSFKDWALNEFRGEGISRQDTITINTNYLNKINQVIKQLQDDISSNSERAFRVENNSEFLGVLRNFYEIEQEAAREEAGEKQLIEVDVSSRELKTILKHPVFQKHEVSLATDEKFIKRNDRDFAVRDVVLHDDFFFGTPRSDTNANPVGEIFTTCEEVPERFQGTTEGSDNIRVTMYHKFMRDLLTERASFYSNGSVSYDDVASSIPTNLTWDRWWRDSFRETYEGITEQLISSIRNSSIFEEPEYLNRLDLKLRSQFYFDPNKGCFRNPNSLLKYGALNYNQLVSDNFPQQYILEYAKPENSILFTDYSMPGAFEKAVMNTVIVGFVRMCLVELLLKGSICYSVWDIDFVRGDKLFREYVYRFIRKQLQSQPFFSDNLVELDDTIIRVSRTNNIDTGLRKIVFAELDGIISDISKNLFENDASVNYSGWFLDTLPLVEVPKIKQDVDWISSLQFQDISQYRKNNFAFLEEYVRVNGPLRGFNSNRQEIANAQLETLNANMIELNQLTFQSNLRTPDISNYEIANLAAVRTELYEDDDEFPNTEVMSIEEFSKVIRSLLENNSELSKFFCDMTRRIYNPSQPERHNLPKTLETKTPTKAIKRTFKRYEFSNKNIFSALFKASSIHNDPENPNSTSMINASDKFRTLREISKQSKDSYFFNELMTGERNSDYQQVTDSNIKNSMLGALKTVESYEDEYNVLYSDLNSVLYPSEYNQFFELRTDDDKISIYSDFDQIGEPFELRPEDELIQKDRNGAIESYLFRNDSEHLNEETFDQYIEDTPELTTEFWEHTIIDLVGDGSPIFNQPGENNFDPSNMSDEDKEELGGLLERQLKFTRSGGGQRHADGSGYTDRTYGERNRIPNATPEITATHPDSFVLTCEYMDHHSVEGRSPKAYPCRSMGHIETDWWTRDDRNQSTMAHTQRLRHTFASNDIPLDRATDGRTSRKYEVGKEYELLGLNDYKIPLRILLTQIRDADGNILKTFARYIIPDVVNFKDKSGIISNVRRTMILKEAMKECLLGFQKFNVTAVKKILTEASISNQTYFNENKSVLSRPEDPESSGVYYKHEVFNIIQSNTGTNTSEGRRGVPVLFRYPGTNSDSDNTVGTSIAQPGDTSQMPSFCSISKFYSTAAQIEARKKETKAFSITESDIKDHFNNLGSLVRNPANDMEENYAEFADNFYNMASFGGSFETSDRIDVARDKSRLQLQEDKDLEVIIRELYTHAQLQNHELYRESVQDMLDSIFITGIEMSRATDNAATKSLKSIGSMVSWFGQRRKDSFWGFTSDPSHIQNTPDHDDVDAVLLHEAPFYNCGPSLFYGDGRASLFAFLWAKITYAYQRHEGDPVARVQTIANSANGILPFVNRTVELFATRPESSRYGVPPTLANGYTYTYFTQAFGKHRCLNDFIQTVKARAEEIRGKGATVVLPNFDPRFVSENATINSSLTHYARWSDDLTRKLGLHLYQSETRSGSGWSNKTRDSVRENELPKWSEHQNKMKGNFLPLISRISSAYNAGLEELGILQVIRRVNSSYVRNLEDDSDQSIISDILEDSDIKYGIRVNIAMPTSRSGDSQRTVKELIKKIWKEDTVTTEEERAGHTLLDTGDGMQDLYTLPVCSYEHTIPPLGCYQAYSPTVFRQKTIELQPTVKNLLSKEQVYKDFFEFIIPARNIGSGITIHSTSMLAGYGDMPFIMTSVKSSLASVFSNMAQVDPQGNNFGIDIDEAQFTSMYGMLGPAGGQDASCFDFPALGQWWKIIQEMILQYIKYFPSVILRGIADAIDPAYKEMKRHYFACEIPDLTNRSWGASSGAGNTPLGLRGGERKNKRYAPIIPAFPVDLAKGVGRLPNPRYLVKSIDKLVGYVYGGPLPLLDPSFAFKVPCMRIDQESPNSWQPFMIGNSGRYGQPLTPLTALALLTYELPADRDLRSNICTDVNGNRIPCPDEFD